MSIEPIPKRFWEDDAWITEHYIELQKKYKECWIAVVNKKVVAVGNGPIEVRKKAIEKTKVKHIPVAYMDGGSNIY